MVSRLQVLNHMLSVLGEGGISNQDSLHPSAVTARRILETEDADFQGPGWWFNREYKLPLVVDEAGEIHLPDNTMDAALSNVHLLAPEQKTRYVKRGSRMYDNREHTFSIGQTLVMDIVTQLEIGDLPSVASSYLMHRAALAMFLDDDGDVQKYDRLERRVSDAWQKLKATHMKNVAANALDNPTAQHLRAGMPTGYRNPNYIGGFR